MKILNNITTKYKLQRAKTLKYLEYKRIKRLRKNSIPPYSNCKNRNEKLEGMYCYKCGQYALDTNQHIIDYIKQFFDNTYQLDGRAFYTLKYLTVRPGFLSLEFIKGRVKSYVHPMKLYMLLSAIFFTLIFFFFGDINAYEKFKINEHGNEIVENIKTSDSLNSSSNSKKLYF